MATADDWKTQELTLDGVPLRVRFVAQRRLNEIGRLLTRTGEPDFDKQAELLAKERIAGWEKLTPLDALGWGFEDYETLPTDADGYVPFTEANAVTLYRGCLFGAFRHHIDTCSLNIAREVAQAKKRAAA